MNDLHLSAEAMPDREVLTDDDGNGMRRSAVIKYGPSMAGLTATPRIPIDLVYRVVPYKDIMPPPAGAGGGSHQ